MSRLSIIIPLHSPQAVPDFEGTLASVLSSLPDGAEVLVPDVVGYGDPWSVGGEGVRFLPLSSGISLIGALNSAIAESQGPILHILQPGMEVEDGWTDEVFPHFDNELVAAVIPALIDSSKERLISLGVLYRNNGEVRSYKNFRTLDPQVSTIAPHVGASFFRKRYLELMGGFDPSFSLQVALVNTSLMFQCLGCETIVETDSRVSTNLDKFTQTSHFYWGFQTERLYFRWSRLVAQGTGLEHFVYFQSDFWRRLPSLSAFSVLAGRLAAFATSSERKKHEEFCELLRQQFSSEFSLPVEEWADFAENDEQANSADTADRYVA